MPNLVQRIFDGVASNPDVQAQAVVTAISVLLGFTPRTVKGQGYTEIVFTPEQEDAVISYLNNLLSSSPGKVRIDMKMIVIRVFLKNFWFVLAGPFVGGFLTGRRSKRHGK